MRISPKQFLQGLLYLTPITLLALASCGGGSNTTLASYYTLSVSVTGISGVSTAASGVVLRNGGDNLTLTTNTTMAFAHQVLSGSTYNISVLTQPTTSPNKQVCTVAGPVSTMPAANTTVGVSCVTGYTIGGSTSTLPANTSVVLQNNGGDNLVVTAVSGVNQTNFTFSTPVALDGSYHVTVLTNPPGYSCTASPSNITSPVSSNVNTVSISCSAITGATPPDQHFYVANSGDNTAWTYSASGVPATQIASTGSVPSAIAVFGGKYAFVTNRGANTVSAYSVASGVLSAAPIANTVTGNTPVAIAVHPSGKFVYVVNQLSNSISAYSITSTGALAAIDADAVTPDMQPSISTGAAFIPVAIAINPAGTYAYVASLGDSRYSTSCGSGATTGCITAYQIDQSTGALTSAYITISSKYIATGINPSSIAVDGTNVYVTNKSDDNIGVYQIALSGQLNAPNPTTPYSNSNPSSIALDPVGGYAYVANSGTTNNVSVYSITGSTLSTTPLHSYPTGVTGGAPASIAIDSTGQYAYVANSGDNTISAFHITGGGATLGTALGPYNAGLNPVSITTGP